MLIINNSHTKSFLLHEITAEDLQCLINGDANMVYIPESDYGLAEIYYDNEKQEFELFEIPMYGGEPKLSGRFKEPEEVIKTIHIFAC